MKDMSNEKLEGYRAVIAFSNCLRCENLEPCTNNHWVITCDKDGETCDNFEARKEQ